MTVRAAVAEARPRALILSENESVPHDRRVWQISTSLVRRGFDVVVVAPQGEGDEAAPIEQRDGVVLHRYPPPPGGRGVLGYAREYVVAVFRIWRLGRRLARRGRFDIVHACNPPDFLVLAGFALRRRGTRLVFDQHDLVPELYLSRFDRGRDVFYWLTRVFERLAFALADTVLATNDSYRSVALSRGRKRPEDVFVVRNAPDLTRFRPVAPDPALKRGKSFLLAYVGVMGPQDGVDYGLRALALLNERRDDWHALFVGDGDVLPELRELGHALGLDGLVEFTGWLEPDGVVRVLSTADVCLAPEPRSPLNDVSTLMKIAEYMAMSRPIVSFDLRESRVTAGEAAVYVPDNDEGLFARAVEDLLADSERRTAMGAVGSERIRELSWARSEMALLSAYTRALNGRGPLRPAASST